MCGVRATVEVRVIEHGQLVKLVLYLLLCGFWRDTQDGVEVLVVSVRRRVLGIARLGAAG